MKDASAAALSPAQIPDDSNGPTQEETHMSIRTGRGGEGGN